MNSLRDSLGKRRAFLSLRPFKHPDSSLHASGLISTYSTFSFVIFRAGPPFISRSSHHFFFPLPPLFPCSSIRPTMRFPTTTILALLSVAVAGSAAPIELVERGTLTKTGDGMLGIIRVYYTHYILITWLSLATFYTPDLGACGKVNKSSDLIVAAPHSVFDSYP